MYAIDSSRSIERRLLHITYVRRNRTATVDKESTGEGIANMSALPTNCHGVLQKVQNYDIDFIASTLSLVLNMTSPVWVMNPSRQN